MHIGIDARLVFYNKAGIGQYIIHLTKAISKLQSIHERFTILQSRKDKFRILENSNFARVSLWTPSHNWFEKFALRFETMTLGLDLLHSPDFIPPLWRNFKSVITVHDLSFMLYPKFMTKESARYYGQIDQAVRSTDHIIAVSEATKEDLTKLLGVPEQKISVIYEGVNPIYQPTDKREAIAAIQKKWQIEPGFIFFISTLEPRKNIPALLKSYKYLRDKYKIKEPLVLAGKQGWFFEEVERTLQELKLENEAIFLGRVSDSDVKYLYNTAGMLVYPSFYEGFGLPPLEAMQCGTPVIASKIKVMPEVVGDAALLIDPHDHEDLASAIYRLLNDEQLCQDLIHKGTQQASKFSWEKAACETIDVYRKVGS